MGRERMNGHLKITGLSKSFGRKSVFRDLNLTINGGRVYGFLGKNGEEKTTPVRILMGVIPNWEAVISALLQKLFVGSLMSASF